MTVVAAKTDILVCPLPSLPTIDHVMRGGRIKTGKWRAFVNYYGFRGKALSTPPSSIFIISAAELWFTSWQYAWRDGPEHRGQLIERQRAAGGWGGGSVPYFRTLHVLASPVRHRAVRRPPLV